MKSNQKSFEQEIHLLKEKGYKTKEVTLTSKQAMIQAICFALPFLIGVVGIYRIFLIRNAHLLELGTLSLNITLIVIVAVSVVAHELLHGFGWMIGSKKGWSTIHFTINALMPLCSCQGILSKKQYLLGVLFPIIVLGTISFVFLVVYPGTISLLTIITNLVAAGADFVIAWHVLHENKDTLISDHPTKAGYVSYQM